MNQKLTKEEALAALKEAAKDTDAEGAHVMADRILLDYIADEEIADAWEAIEKSFE